MVGWEESFVVFVEGCEARLEVLEDRGVTVGVETVAVDAGLVFEEAEESGFGVSFL